MRTLPLFIIILIFFNAISITGKAATFPANVKQASRDSALNVSYTWEQLASMKPKEAEKLLGTKMTLREKLAFKLAQAKLKKAIKAKEEGKSSEGQTAFVLALIGLIVLFIPYVNIASIPLAILGIVKGSRAKKINKNDSKAQTAIVLGIVTLGLIVLALILAIIWLASWSWY